MEARLLSHSQASCSLSDRNLRQHVHLQRRNNLHLIATRRRVHSSRGQVSGNTSGIRHAARCKRSLRAAAKKSPQDANAYPDDSSCTAEEGRCKGKSAIHLSYVAPTCMAIFRAVRAGTVHCCRSLGGSAAAGGKGVPRGGTDRGVRHASARAGSPGGATRGPASPGMVCPQQTLHGAWLLACSRPA
jgi:hypothetical protein